MSVLNADYFDGKSSVKHPVTAVLSGRKLKIIGQDVSQVHDLRRVRRSLRIGNTPRWLYLPGGGVCVTSDNDAVDRATRKARYERFLHRWESRPLYALAAVALVVGALWLLMDRGLPAAADQIAQRIPVETEAVLGRETLAGLERFGLRRSTLPAERQRALRETFAAVVRSAEEPMPYRLEFRASPFGANAFALPGGIIVMTDELVHLAKNDEEIIGVLAHELGHVRHRHSMRGLLEGSATALIIAGVTGDVASATSLAAGAPAFLLQARYSRDNEREADRYAIEVMRKTGLHPRYFATLLQRMEGNGEASGFVPTFLSTHPATEERAALAVEGDVRPDDGKSALEALAERPLRASGAKAVEGRSAIAMLRRRDFPSLEMRLTQKQQAYVEGTASEHHLLEAFRELYTTAPELEAAFDAWVAAYPQSYSARLARGIYYKRLGMQGTGNRALYYRNAMADFDASLELEEKPVLTYLYMMDIAKYSPPRSIQVWLLRVKVTDPKEAVLKQALELAPDSFILRRKYMMTLQTRWGGSVAAMNAFLAECRKADLQADHLRALEALVLADRAWVKLHQQDHQGALQDYRQVLALVDIRNAELFEYGNQGLLLHQVGYAYRAAEEYAEAVRYLSQAVDFGEDDDEVYVSRGFSLYQLGRKKEALDDYLRAAERGSAWAQNELGIHYWHGIVFERNKEEAIKWFGRSAEQGFPAGVKHLDWAKKL